MYCIKYDLFLGAILAIHFKLSGFNPFSRLGQELPLVALPQQEKSGFHS
jgi:hypothetical protein